MYLVTGASGNVGAQVVQQLTDRGEPVRALSRRSASWPQGVEPVVGDLDHPDDLAGGLAGVRGIFLLPGYAGAQRLLELAVDAGVDRVVLLSGGSAGLADKSNAVTAYMSESEDVVRAGGPAWTIIRPNAFMSNALRWLPQLNDGDVVRLPFADVASAIVDPVDIAAVAVTALVDDGHDAAIYRPSGPIALRPPEQLAVLAQVLGRDLRGDVRTDDQARADMQADGTPPKYIEAFLDFYAAGSLDESVVTSDVRDVTGRPARTFEQWARDHASDFA